MRDIERRRVDALKRCVQFFLDNLDTLNTGVTRAKFNELIEVVILIDNESMLAESHAGQSFGATDQKGTIRENLRDRCSAIVETAKGMEPDYDGISAIFRFRRNLNDADLLARAKGFAQAAIPYEADFIAYNLPETFLAELNGEISNFEVATNSQSTNVGERVEAHAGLADAISKGMTLKRTVDALVRNKFSNDAGKLAAWASASHVEKAPSKPIKPPTV